MASSAATPSCASTSGTMTGCAASNFRRRERAEASSSAINALISTQWHSYSHAGSALVRPAVDDHSASLRVQCMQPVLHFLQPDPASLVEVRAQPYAIVFDLHSQVFALELRDHTDATAAADRRKPVT